MPSTNRYQYEWNIRWPYLVFNRTMSCQGCGPSSKFTSRGLLLHRGLFMLITWKGFRPWGSSRSHWSTSDWAELHRWAGQRRGLTDAKWRSPCGGKKKNKHTCRSAWRSRAGGTSDALGAPDLKPLYSVRTQGPLLGCHVPPGCQLPNLRASTKLSTLQGFSLE